MLTNDLIIRFAKAYAIHAISICSDNTKAYWEQVVKELTEMQQSEKMKAFIRKEENN